MTKGSTWLLVAEKKRSERGRLERLCAALRGEQADFVQRCRYIDGLVSEYSSVEGETERVARFDDQLLTGRRYVSQLLRMKNALTLKRMDVEVRLQRAQSALQNIELERQRYEKFEALAVGKQRQLEERRSRQDEDRHGLQHYHLHSGKS